MLVQISTNINKIIVGISNPSESIAVRKKCFSLMCETVPNSSLHNQYACVLTKKCDNIFLFLNKFLLHLDIKFGYYLQELVLWVFVFSFSSKHFVVAVKSL